MMTSLLADKSFIVKNKKKLNFMNKTTKPPCNSVLAMFFELSFEACRKRVSSCLKTLVRTKWTITQLFELLFPLPLLMSLQRKLLEREARRVLWEVRRDQLEKVVCARRRLVRRQMWRTRTKMLTLLVPFTRLGSLGTSLRVSRSQKSCAKKDSPRRMCPRFSLTPLTFHHVSFQIFNIYN